MRQRERVLRPRPLGPHGPAARHDAGGDALDRARRPAPLGVRPRRHRTSRRSTFATLNPVPLTTDLAHRRGLRRRPRRRRPRPDRHPRRGRRGGDGLRRARPRHGDIAPRRSAPAGGPMRIRSHPLPCLSFPSGRVAGRRPGAAPCSRAADGGGARDAAGAAPAGRAAAGRAGAAPSGRAEGERSAVAPPGLAEGGRSGVVPAPIRRAPSPRRAPVRPERGDVASRGRLPRFVRGQRRLRPVLDERLPAAVLAGRDAHSLRRHHVSFAAGVAWDVGSSSADGPRRSRLDRVTGSPCRSRSACTSASGATRSRARLPASSHSTRRSMTPPPRPP